MSSQGKRARKAIVERIRKEAWEAHAAGKPRSSCPYRYCDQYQWENAWDSAEFARVRAEEDRMTQERDDYMRRQAMDHDLLAMRDRSHTQRYGRATRPLVVAGSVPPVLLDFENVRAGVIERIERTGSFEWDLSRMAPSPRERMEQALRDVGVEEGRIAAVMRSLCAVNDVVAAVEYERGVRDGMSRARNRPGDGDMGG